MLKKSWIANGWALPLLLMLSFSASAASLTAELQVENENVNLVVKEQGTDEKSLARLKLEPTGTPTESRPIVIVEGDRGTAGIFLVNRYTECDTDIGWYLDTFELRNKKIVKINSRKWIDPDSVRAEKKSLFFTERFGFSPDGDCFSWESLASIPNQRFEIPRQIVVDKRVRTAISRLNKSTRNRFTKNLKALMQANPENAKGDSWKISRDRMEAALK